MTNHNPLKETQVSVDNYYANAKHWQQEIYHSLSLRLRWSVCLNGFCLLLLVLSLSCLCLLLPLKQTVPFVFSHHPKTGELTQLGELQPANFSGDWTLIRYFLMRYVSLRESFHSDDIERPYQLTYAMSEHALATQYDREVDSQNPNSPYQRFGTHTFVRVNVGSIARLNTTTAEVHFDKIVQDKTSGKETVQPMVAIIKWQFDKTAVTQKMLDRNPLNFKVTYYQLTPVTLSKT